MRPLVDRWGPTGQPNGGRNPQGICVIDGRDLLLQPKVIIDAQHRLGSPINITLYLTLIPQFYIQTLSKLFSPPLLNS